MLKSPHVPADSCLENPCQNGGTCVDGESIRCICLPGYGGDLCQRGLLLEEPAAATCSHLKITVPLIDVVLLSFRPGAV